MIILKNNQLDTHLVLTMDKETGKYGIYDVRLQKAVIEPTYDYIYPFNSGDERTVVKSNGYVHEVDREGKAYFDQYMSIEEYEGEIGIIDKAPTCPECAGDGCATCNGLGVIFSDDEWID